MKRFKMTFIFEGDLEDKNHAKDTLQALIEGTYPPEREMDGGITVSNIKANELDENT